MINQNLRNKALRLDKYLKVSRLIKRRTVAKEASEEERVLVNSKSAKPSKDIKIGDHISIIYGTKMIEVEVISLTVSLKKADASLMYQLISEKSL